VLQVPIALVSLVDTPVQWFKSAQGLGDVDRTPRNTSFCAWWVDSPCDMLSAASPAAGRLWQGASTRQLRIVLAAGSCVGSSARAAARQGVGVRPRWLMRHVVAHACRTLLPAYPEALVVEDAQKVRECLRGGPGHLSGWCRTAASLCAHAAVHTLDCGVCVCVCVCV
jgi:hypothetical protein